MAFKIGANLALDGEKEFKSAIADMNGNLKVLQSEMKALSSEFGAEDKSLSALTAKQATLSQTYEQQAEKVKQLETALKSAVNNYGEGSRQAQNWEIQLNNARAAMSSTEKELNKTNKELDEMKQSDRAVEKLKTAFSGLKDKVGDAKEKTEKLREALSKIGSFSMSALKAGIAGVGAAAGASVALVKQVTQAYGELEQNVGGAESVFGKYADSVKATSADAYKTLGATQSDYLATANKMGALFQGSGVEQQRSAELTTQAMQRAADMASVMGVETSAALEAVTGAAKGNYTMMDNLGVKMDATTLKAYAAGKGYEKAFKDMSNAEQAEVAMAYFFEQTSQYAGNFEREATQTISGSLGMLSASWQTFVAGLGDSEADIGQLTENVFGALEAVIGNIQPIVENIMSVLPDVIGTALELGEPIVSELLNSIVEALPMLIEVGVPLVMELGNGILQNLPAIIDAAFMLLQAIIDGLNSNPDAIVSAAVAIIGSLSTGLINNLPAIMNAGIQLILGLVQGLANSGAIGQILQAGITCAGELVKGLIQCIPDLMQAGWDLIKGLWNGISDAAKWLWEQLKSIGATLVSTVKGIFKIGSPSKVFRDEIGANLMAGMAVGITDNADEVRRAMREATASLTDDASVSYRISAVEDRIAAAQQPVTYTRTVSATSAGGADTASGDRERKLDRLIELVETYLPAMGEMTLDGDVVSEAVEKRLGRKVAQKARL